MNLVKVGLGVLLVCAIQITKAQDNTAKHRVFEMIDITEEGNESLVADFNPINKIIYQAAIFGRKGVTIDAYKDTTFTEKYTKEELKKMGAAEVVAQYAPYPDDPEYLVDTILYEKFDPMALYDFVLMQDSITTGTKDAPVGEYKIIAIAPVTYDIVMAEVRSNYRAMFWVKYEDLLPVLAKEVFYAYSNRDGRLKFDYLFDQRMFKTTKLYPNFKY